METKSWNVMSRLAVFGGIDAPKSGVIRGLKKAFLGLIREEPQLTTIEFTSQVWVADDDQMLLDVLLIESMTICTEKGLKH